MFSDQGSEDEEAMFDVTYAKAMLHDLQLSVGFSHWPGQTPDTNAIFNVLHDAIGVALVEYGLSGTARPPGVCLPRLAIRIGEAARSSQASLVRRVVSGAKLDGIDKAVMSSLPDVAILYVVRRCHGRFGRAYVPVLLGRDKTAHFSMLEISFLPGRVRLTLYEPNGVRAIRADTLEAFKQTRASLAEHIDEEVEFRTTGDGLQTYLGRDYDKGGLRYRQGYGLCQAVSLFVFRALLESGRSADGFDRELMRLRPSSALKGEMWAFLGRIKAYSNSDSIIRAVESRLRRTFDDGGLRKVGVVGLSVGFARGGGEPVRIDI